MPRTLIKSTITIAIHMVGVEKARNRLHNQRNDDDFDDNLEHICNY
jgi:hypothetical protein